MYYKAFPVLTAAGYKNGFSEETKVPVEQQEYDFIDGLNDMGVNCVVKELDFNSEIFADGYDEVMEDLQNDFKQVIVVGSRKGNETIDQLNRMMAADSTDIENGEFYGFPEEAIKAFEDRNARSNTGIKMALEKDHQEPWKLELKRYTIPETDSAYREARKTTDTRWRLLEAMNDRYDYDLQEVNDAIKETCEHSLENIAD
ncbi:MAG: hypothetical protein BRC26_02085 [Nanohaloarchaea archaeon QH_8_44_6]|nr:MAG: hypothetical protein BRC26_02085 [Nanohaloarchaea archaeon QH_8_44_6]